MQDDPRNSDELISAYIDGALASDARAEVLARAARDPAFARELATMTRLKATLEAAVPVPEIALPRARRPRAVWAAAAALLLMVVAGGGWFVAGREGPVSAGAEWAVAAHRGWEAPAAPAGYADIKLPASLAVIPHVPDLSANGLSLAHAAVADIPTGGRALVVGYLGTRGCRVSLFAAAAGASALVPPRRDRESGVRARAWRSGEIAYLVLAEGMSATRFSLIAGSIERATRARAPLGPDTQMALKRNRAASPPCLT